MQGICTSGIACCLPSHTVAVITLVYLNLTSDYNEAICEIGVRSTGLRVCRLDLDWCEKGMPNGQVDWLVGRWVGRLFAALVETS